MGSRTSTLWTLCLCEADVRPVAKFPLLAFPRLLAGPARIAFVLNFRLMFVPLP